jgi:hypothetical protein
MNNKTIEKKEREKKMWGVIQHECVEVEPQAGSVQSLTFYYDIKDAVILRILVMSGLEFS